MEKILEHKRFLEEAYKEALKAKDKGEVPVGAVIVKEDQIISRGHNLRITEKNPLYHAEIVAIENASRKLDSWRLDECILYVTLEPCLMCAGAIMQSRIKKVVFSTLDTKGGVIVSNLQAFNLNLPFNIEYEYIPMEHHKKLLQDFFKTLRK